VLFGAKSLHLENVLLGSAVSIVMLVIVLSTTKKIRFSVIGTIIVATRMRMVGYAERQVQIQITALMENAKSIAENARGIGSPGFSTETEQSTLRNKVPLILNTKTTCTVRNVRLRIVIT
jgi:hypothetical protein